MEISTILLSLVLCIHIALGIGPFVRANEKPSLCCFILVFISMPVLLLLGCVDLLIKVHKMLREEKVTILQYIKIMKLALNMFLKFAPQMAENIVRILLSIKKHKYTNKYKPSPILNEFDNLFKECKNVLTTY